MAYRTRSVRRVAKKSKRKFIITLLTILFLFYATLQWILPNIIGSVGIITSTFKTPTKTEKPISEDTTLAPPVISIPFEATNSAKIDIKGYATPSSKVELFLDDTLKDTVDVGIDGSFVFKDVYLNPGDNKIFGKTIDSKKLESLPSKTIILSSVTDKPQLSISQPDDNKTIESTDKKVTVSGKADPNAQVLVNGSIIILGSDGKFSTVVMLNDGDNMIKIKAIDRASNYTEITRKVILHLPSPSPSV